MSIDATASGRDALGAMCRKKDVKKVGLRRDTFADWVRLGCFWEVGESAEKLVNSESGVLQKIKGGTSEPAQPSIP
jgi:hypothetical protein